MVTVAETGESQEPSVTLLNQSSDEPSITTTGGEAKLRRQLLTSKLLSGDGILKWVA